MTAAAADGAVRRGRALARLHGTFNVVTGLWPLVHMRSFEAVSGPKADEWLVRTVAGLMVANGLAQLAAGDDREGVAASRRIGAGTALTFAAVDLWYAGRGRISKVYLLDAAVELAWLAAWAAAGRPGERRGAGA